MTKEWKRGDYLIIPKGRGCEILECIEDFRNTVCVGWENTAVDPLTDLKKTMNEMRKDAFDK